MSPQARRKKPAAVRTKRKANSHVTASVIGGAALVLASVLPATLGPGTGGPPSSTTTTTAISKSASAVAFQPGCSLPFDDIKAEGLAVDASCTSDGGAGTNVEKRLESNAKNNFCVQGDPIPIVFDDFTTLESASDQIPDVRKLLKTSRDNIVDIATSAGGDKIGEGTLVQFVGFLFNAHFSNVGSGELVNCKLKAKPDNDIHIELMKNAKEEDECQGVTAEMSPHFRPEVWSELVNLETKNPVRITGPLFFDGSHHPCHDDKRPTPNRISVWEIHPVYQFEVCRAKSLKTCDVRDNSQWVPLDKFLSGEEKDE
jgi:hypothetical protein